MKINDRKDRFREFPSVATTTRGATPQSELFRARVRVFIDAASHLYRRSGMVAMNRILGPLQMPTAPPIIEAERALRIRISC